MGSSGWGLGSSVYGTPHSPEACTLQTALKAQGKCHHLPAVGCFSCFAFCSSDEAPQLLLQMMPCLAKALPQCHPKKLEGSSPSRREEAQCHSAKERRPRENLCLSFGELAASTENDHTAGESNKGTEVLICTSVCLGSATTESKGKG